MPLGSQTSNPATSWLDALKWCEFLRRELAPTPERWAATVRLTLACVICTIPVMIFHLKQPTMVMIGMFMVTREDLATTVLGTILAILAAGLGCGLLLLYFMCGLDLVWLRVLCVPLFVGLGLLMMRLVNPSVLGLGIAVCVGFGITLPDMVSNVEILNRSPFHYWWAWTLGLTANLGIQYLMNPNTSHSVLVRGLTTRLEAVEALLRGLATGDKGESSRPSLAALAFAGAAEQLRLLKIAGTFDSLVKKRKTELTAQIILVDRLVTAAALLEKQRSSPTSDALKRRLLRVADVCAAWRVALGRGAPPESCAPAAGLSADTALSGETPALAEMERVVELLPQVAPGKELPDELQLPSHRGSDFLAPDAFKNPEHIHFMVKGMLAATICYLIFVLFAYPGIYTCVITSIVCSLSTVGASTQKGTLRFAGAVVGGTLGFLCLMYVFPRLDSLVGFWFPFGAVMALAAYVNFGSVRISYVGIQICLAFCKCAFQSYGTYTELRVARDRMMGIALGLVVFGLINSRLWPVTALKTLRIKLADIFRQMARLAMLPDDRKGAEPQVAEAYNLRLKVYQDLSVVGEMLEGSKFESGAAAREKLESLGEEAKALFLRLLPIVRQRRDPGDGVPESLRAATARFRAKLADAAQIIADRLEGRPARQAPDLAAAFSELEHIAASQIEAVRDSRVAAETCENLAVYREAIPIAQRLLEVQTA